MESLIELNDHLKYFFALVGNTKVGGVTLDIPAHIIVGAVIFYICAVRGMSTRKSFFIVLGLEILKEIYDITAVLHQGDYLEPFKDIFFTCLGVALGYYLSRPVNLTKKPS